MAAEFSFPPSQTRYIAFWLYLARQTLPLEHPTSKRQDKSVREQQEQGCFLKEGESEAKREPCEPYLSPTVPEQGEQDRPRVDGKVQPKVQVKMQYNGHKTGLRSSQEISRE